MWRTRETSLVLILTMREKEREIMVMNIFFILITHTNCSWIVVVNMSHKDGGEVGFIIKKKKHTKKCKGIYRDREVQNSRSATVW